MDPFETEGDASTPSPQNNGSGESVHSDDFVKVENSSLLLDLNSEEQGNEPEEVDFKFSPEIEVPPGADLLTGFDGGAGDSSPDRDPNFAAGQDNAGFEDSPIEDKFPASATQIDDKPSDNLITVDEPAENFNDETSPFEQPKQLIPEDDFLEQYSPQDNALTTSYGDFGEEIESEDEDSVVRSPEVLENKYNESDSDKELLKEEFTMKTEDFKPKPAEMIFKPEIKDNTINEGKKKSPDADIKPEEPTQTAVSSDSSTCVFSPVAELLYWRDVKKSGITFGSSLLILLSLTYFSLISVIAYLSLGLLSVAMSFRIYKNILTAVQKSNEGHPFKKCLDKEFTVSSEKFKEVSETALQHLEFAIKRTKSLFLVEDIVDSIKFGIVLWVLTYIGAWFNGMTLLILAFVAAFTLPKVYETHQTQIDHYLGIANQQIKDVMDKVKAKIPMLNKKKEE